MLIAFSGSSLSGKTTTMNKLEKLFNESGYDVTILSENIREYYDTSIDDIRSDPSLYLKIQIKAINTKIQNERNLYNNKNIVLVDRSICDSLFYALHYVNSNNFSDKELNQYRSLLENINEHIEFNPYSVILDFGILGDDIKSDNHRPVNIHNKKHIEYLSINTLSQLLKPKFRMFIDPTLLDYKKDYDYHKIMEEIVKNVMV